MSAPKQPSSAQRSVRARKSPRLSAAAILGRAITEALERRQLLSVTGASIGAQTSQVYEHNAAVFTLAATTDTGDGTTWVINPGDGTGDQAPVFVAAGQQGEFDHTFPGDEGASCTVTAKVYDDACCGSGGDDSPYDATPADVSIGDAPISFAPQDSVATTEGDAQDAIVLGTINDQDPNPDAGDYSGEINWGDGTITPVTIDGNTVEGIHPYTDEGTYTATVTINDEGGSSSSGSVEVFADDAPITVSASNPGTFVEGQNSGDVVVGQVTDQNPFTDGTDLSGTIDWGDGPNGADGTDTSAARFVPVGQPDGTDPVTFDIVGSHAYTTFGDFNLSLAVQDRGGSSGSDSTSVYLQAPTVNVGSTIVGVGQTLEVPVSLTGDSAANQPLAIVSYDPGLIQATWENGSVTDANGNANLLVTGVDFGATDLVVEMANFVNAQGAGQQQVAHDTLTLSSDAVTVCTNAGTPQDPTANGHVITATLTFPNGNPAAGFQVGPSLGGSDNFGASAIDGGTTNAQGQTRFKVYGIESNEGEPDDLQIEQIQDPTVFANAEVTVVVPHLIMQASGSLNFDPQGNPDTTIITVTAVDPTTGNPITIGLLLQVSLSNDNPNFPAGTLTSGDTALTDANGHAQITVKPVPNATANRTATLTVLDPEVGGELVTCSLIVSGNA